jgi:multidrug transporter EmrE-like cation transporter
MSIAGAVLLSLLAYALLSAGMVLMKKGIAWIGHKGPKDPAWRRDFGTWVSGFLVSNLYIVPSLAALGTLTPHVVAAFAGFGVVVLVLLSRAVLGERLYRSDILYTAAIFLSIVVLNVLEPSPEKGSPNGSFLAGAAAFPPLLFTAAFIKGTARTVRTAIFASTSGMATGMIVVLMKVLVDVHGFRLADYFGSPHFYLYLVFSLGGFIALQLAYRSGTMMMTGPLQYGSSIVYPAVCSSLVFGNAIGPVQIASLAAIVLGVAGILRKHA